MLPCLADYNRRTADGLVLEFHPQVPAAVTWAMDYVSMETWLNCVQFIMEN